MMVLGSGKIFLTDLMTGSMPMNENQRKEVLEMEGEMGWD